VRIIIYGLNFWPELTGIGKYTGEMAEWLAESGHKVSVITSSPYYPNWRIQNGYSGWKYKKEYWGKVEIYRCPLWIPAKPSGFKRIIHLLSFMLSSLPVLLFHAMRWRPELIWTVEPTFFTAPPTLLAAFLAGSKTWLHVQDFEIDAARGLGLVRRSVALNFMASVERFFMKRFNAVSSISEAMVRKLAERGIPSGKTFLFYNWVDTDLIHPLDKAKSLRADWGVGDDRVVVLYSGNIGRKQGLDLLFPVAEEFREKHPQVLFIIAGDGAAKSDLVSEVKRRQLDNVRFKPLQPFDKLSALLATGDIHLVLQKRGVADLAMPSKLTGIFAAGGAAIVTADPGTELHRIVNQQGLGLTIIPESPEKLAEGLDLLIKDGNLRQSFQNKARRYAEEVLSKDLVLAGFEKKCKEMSN